MQHFAQKGLWIVNNFSENIFLGRFLRPTNPLWAPFRPGGRKWTVWPCVSCVWLWTYRTCTGFWLMFDLHTAKHNKARRVRLGHVQSHMCQHHITEPPITPTLRKQWRSLKQRYHQSPNLEAESVRKEISSYVHRPVQIFSFHWSYMALAGILTGSSLKESSIVDSSPGINSPSPFMCSSRKKTVAWTVTPSSTVNLR